MTKGIKIRDADIAVQSSLFENLEAPPLTYSVVILNKEKFVQVLSEIKELNSEVIQKFARIRLEDV